MTRRLAVLAAVALLACSGTAAADSMSLTRQAPSTAWGATVYVWAKTPTVHVVLDARCVAGNGVGTGSSEQDVVREVTLKRTRSYTFRGVLFPRFDPAAACRVDVYTTTGRAGATVTRWVQ